MTIAVFCFSVIKYILPKRTASSTVGEIIGWAEIYLEGFHMQGIFSFSNTSIIVIYIIQTFASHLKFWQQNNLVNVANALFYSYWTISSQVWVLFYFLIEEALRNNMKWQFLFPSFKKLGTDYEQPDSMHVSAAVSHWIERLFLNLEVFL